MKFEDLYEYVGQLGVYQLCCVITFTLFAVFTIESITMVFVGAEMPHWCKVPELANLSYEHQRLIAIPWSDANDPTTYSSCEMYDLSYSNYSDDDFLAWNRSIMLPNDTDVISCPAGWLYEQSVFVSTIVSRFDLVCETAYLNQLVSTIYMFGVLIGVTSSGAISDKIGRKITIFIFLTIRCIGYGIAFPAIHYAMLCVGRFVMGIGQAGCFLGSYVLVAELVGPRFRTVVGVGIQIAFSVGFALQAPIAYAVRHDIKYQVASLAGSAVIFYALFLYIPESPRWLAVNGKKSKAQKVLDEICSGNGTSLPENFDLDDLEKDDNEDIKKKNCTALFSSPKLRTRTLIMDFSWFTCSLVYYALSLNTGTLSGDIFVNTFFSGIVEIPANIICIFLLDWKVLGRRLTLAGSFLVAGIVSFIGVPLTLYDYGTASTAMAIIGKGFVTMSFSVVYVFSSELFPTEVRNVGIGTASMFARIASMIAPYLGAPLIEIWEPLPSVLFGSVATLNGLLCLLLPETLGHPLLDTIEQTEQYDWKRRPSKKTDPSSKAVSSLPQSDSDAYIATAKEKEDNLVERIEFQTKFKPEEESKPEADELSAEKRSVSSDLCYQF